MSAAMEFLVEMQKSLSQSQQRLFRFKQKSVPPQNENSHHVFSHMTTLRAQDDVRDVAL